MFVLELVASDLYAVLGRFLDSARVADLKLSTVRARESAGHYTIRATIDVRDAESVERLARKLRTIVGVTEVVTRQNQSTQDQREAETLLVS
jgi:hypothetical protein